MTNDKLKKISRLALILLMVGSAAYSQQQLSVSGRIINSSSEAVKDVTISFDGNTGAPAVSDSLGNFELLVPDGNVWLSISPIGTYKEKQVYLNKREELTIYLTELGEKSIYDELIYMGSARAERDIVSAVNSVKPANMTQDSYESVDQKVQGRIPGVYQVGMSGMPGSGTFMLLGGLNSINTNNQPLIIVDGIPLETPGLLNSLVGGNINHPLASLDNMDITNMTFIRDGAVPSSYGVKGSNGLLLIETLKPSETTTSIEFQYKTGMYYTDKRIPLLDADQYKTLAKEILSTSPYPEEQYAERYPGLYYLPSSFEHLRYSHNTDWQEQIYQNGWMNDIYLGVKGGDAIARYGLSVGYLGHNGLFDNTNYNRFNTRFVGTFNVFQWLRMYVSANLVSATSNYKSSALSAETSPLLTALSKTPQMYPYAYDQNGKLLTTIDEVDELGVSNPRAVMDSYVGTNTNYRFLTSIRLEADLAKNLKLNALIGLNINDIKEQVFMPNLGMEYYLDGEAYNISQSLNNYLFTMYNDNYVSYSEMFNGKHLVQVNGGIRWQTNNYQEDWGVAMNSQENDQYSTLQAGENELRDVSGDNGKWNWLSGYVNGSYAFKDRYLFDASMSMDYSTRTGSSADNAVMISEYPFGLFYSVGGAWRISGESFMSGVDFIEDLKLRVNYGTTGNDDIGNYSSYAYYTLKLYRESSGMVPGGFPNQFLTFETSSRLSGGLDLSMFGNRLMLKGNYYTTHTTNLLIYEQLTTYVGYEIFPSNNAALKGSGYDASISARIIKRGGFALDIGMNIGHFESKVDMMPDGEVVNEIPGGAQIINRVGDPTNSFYGYQYNGVFSTPEDAAEAGLVNEKGLAFGAGDAIFEDISGPDGVKDQIIDDYDKVILGSATPDLYGGISLDIFFKRFRLEMFWQGSYGGEVFNYLRYQNEKMTDLSNQSAAVLDRWVSPGQETNIPRALWGDPVGNSAFSSRWIEDGSYIRLKHLSLSYTIPGEVWFMKSLKLFVTGSNLFTASNYLSYDPEFSYGFGSMLQGVDYGTMPMGRRIMIGIKFGL